MNNWENDLNKRTSAGAMGDKVPEEILDWLKSIISKTKDKKNLDVTNKLAGNLKEEYLIFMRPTQSNKNRQGLVKSDDMNFLNYQKYIDSLCFNPFFKKFWENINILSENRPLQIDSSWVNFQKKYEYNTMHDHCGLFSWVIFVNIPYDLEEEEKCFATGESTTTTSKFFFAYPSNSSYFKSSIKTSVLNVDKSYEGKIIIFPAHTLHGVNPFYTSDEYRITISGNMVFQV